MSMAEHISQRELRNESGKILRAVEAGEEFVITNRGRPVARLVGVEDLSLIHISEPTRRS